MAWEELYQPVLNQLVADSAGRYTTIDEGWQNAENAAIAQRKSDESKINKSFEEAARQAYVRQRLNEMSLPALLQSGGVTGGAAESSLGRLNIARENAVIGSQKERDANLSNLATAYMQAQAERNNNRLTQRSALDAQLQNEAILKAQLLFQQKEAERQAEQQRLEQQRWEQEMAFQREQYAAQQAQLAQQAASAGRSAGRSGGGSGGSGLGWTNTISTASKSPNYGGGGMSTDSKYVTPKKPTAINSGPYTKKNASNAYIAGRKW